MMEQQRARLKEVEEENSIILDGLKDEYED